MNELTVQLLHDPSRPRTVGTLVEDRGRVWFAWNERFKASGLQLSPIRLPLSGPDLRPFEPKHGVPIPGVFNDSRPDGWGLKLLHKAFHQLGRSSSSVSALEELAYLGTRTMGALGYFPSTGPTSDLHQAVELSELAQHAQQVWDDRVETVLPQLLRAGGPSGGARPKALIGLPADGSSGVCIGEGDLPEGFHAWLVKFPTSTDDPDHGRRELAYLHLAKTAGINVPEARLLELDQVGHAFAVRRFDRPGANQRRHLLSAAGALDVDFRRAVADYEHLLKATSLICSGNQAQVLAAFRLAAFNVCFVNEDDHLKNIAWLMDADGRWRLTPGYDLTYSPRPYGDRWTTVCGKSRDIQRSDLLELASRLRLSSQSTLRILREVTDAARTAPDVFRDLGCKHAVSHAALDAIAASTAAIGA